MTGRNSNPLNTLGFAPDEIARCCERKGLLSIELEFTKRCNLKCIYCYSDAGEPVENELGIDELISAVDQARDLGAKKIIMLGGGEPLLYEGLEDIITYIRSIGLDQIIFTNGTMMDRRKADLMMRNGVSVIIKQNSRRPEVQDMLAGVKGTFENIQRGLSILEEAGYGSGRGRLGIQTVICKHNIRELPSMWTWAREKGIIPYFEMLTRQGRAKMNRGLYVSVAEAKEVFAHLESIDRNTYGIQWESHPTIAAFSCRRHLYSCLVNSRGGVQPCSGVDLPVGNIRSKPLREILNTSPVINKLRNVYEHLEGHCRECEHGHECYGCRGNAYQITGNYLASDPTCWNYTKIENEHPACLCKQ